MAACSSDDPGSEEYAAGLIPGLGDTPGELTGTPFTLPAGIKLAAEIYGGGDQYLYWASGWGYEDYSHTFTRKDGTVESRGFATTRAEGDVVYRGSGYGYVDLMIQLENTESTSKTVTFPAALIVENISGLCQNGVLIKKTEVVVPANSTVSVCLAMYCGNASKSSASTYDEYVWGVVSNASPLLELCEMVKDKKINIEEFEPNEENYFIYSSQTSYLQDIVWEVTDYMGMSEYSIEYLNSLPKSN